MEAGRQIAITRKAIITNILSVLPYTTWYSNVRQKHKLNKTGFGCFPVPRRSFPIDKGMSFTCLFLWPHSETKVQQVLGKALLAKADSKISQKRDSSKRKLPPWEVHSSPSHVN